MTFSLLLSIATVLAQVATVVLFLLWLRDRKSGTRDALTSWLHRNGLWLAAAVAVVASVSSLVFSEAIGFPPCKFCWYQRTLMYPMAVILAIAAWVRDRNVIRYALGLALVGGLVALNHTVLQAGGGSLLPCSAPGIGTEGCDQRFVFEFGFVTIPMMSLTAFAFIGALLAHASNSVRGR